MFVRHTILATLAVSIAGAGATLPAQCTSPQGNARLFLSGLPRIGNAMTLGLDGAPLQPFVLWADTSPGTCSGPWGQLCLSCNTMLPVVGGRLPSQPFLANFQIPVNSWLVGQSVYFQGAVVDTAAPNGAFAISNAVSMTIDDTRVKTVFFDDFEAGQGLWSATQGLWQIGTPSAVGPANAWSGSQCAATNLGGRYAGNQSSRLLSPPIALPAIAPGEQIRLTYRLWFDTEDCCDTARVTIGGNTLPGTVVSGWNKLWVRAGADLTAQAGQSVQLGFDFSSSPPRYEGDGVYIDDVHVFVGKPELRNPEDWEQGMGDWWFADKGVWQVGVPTGCTAHSGTQCAGTNLSGNYPGDMDSRLVGPEVTLTTESSLVFWECFATEVCCDFGQVQVSERNPSGGWMPWTNLGNSVSGQSSGWTQRLIGIKALQGKTVRFGFLFTSSPWRYEGAGWFLDDIRLL